jgi:hypothetical protein
MVAQPPARIPVLVQYVTAGEAILVADQRRGLAAGAAKRMVGFVERMTEKGRSATLAKTLWNAIGRRTLASTPKQKTDS